MFDLSGKAAVVTGGGSGVGRGIARSLALAGARVVIAGRTASRLEDCVAELRRLGASVSAVTADVASTADIQRVIEAAENESGGVDIWVNNAGSADRRDVGALLTLTEAQWDAVVDLNLKWTFFAAQAAARVMGPGGSIINISSRSGSQPNPMTGQYGAAKAGIENLTATMAVEWGHLGIRVNAVAPGVIVDSASSAVLDPGRMARQLELEPLRRLGLPDDVGAACVFLASEEAGWITGEVLQVTGGSRLTIGYLPYLKRVQSGGLPSR